MLRAVEEWSAADCSKGGARDELETYLDKLEKMEDIVGWWGVSVPSLLWYVVLMWHSESLDTVPNSCMNGPGLSSYSRLGNTFRTFLLERISHRLKAVQLAGTGYIRGTASSEERVP
jgi:hypothetical protein